MLHQTSGSGGRVWGRAHLWVAGVRVVTDVFWEHRADQRLHLRRVNVGRRAPSFLLHTHIVKDLQKKKDTGTKRFFISLFCHRLEKTARQHAMIWFTIASKSLTPQSTSHLFV